MRISDWSSDVCSSDLNYDNKLVEGAISGPLFGNIKGRLAGSWNSIGKGYFENLSPGGKSEGNRGDIWDVEGQLEGELGDGKLDWWRKASTGEWHNLGRGPGGRTSTTIGLRDTTTVFIGALTPNSQFGYGEPQSGNICQFCFRNDDGNYISLETNTYNAQATLRSEEPTSD